MFYYSATQKLVRGESIQIFNYGDMKRDFTYIDDIVEGIIRVMQGAPERATGEDGLPVPPYALYNIGCSQPVHLGEFIEILFDELRKAGLLSEDCGIEDHLIYTDMQPGDVIATYADCSALERDFGYRPRTGIREGLRNFIEWYRDYPDNTEKK